MRWRALFVGTKIARWTAFTKEFASHPGSLAKVIGELAAFLMLRTAEALSIPGEGGEQGDRY